MSQNLAQTRVINPILSEHARGYRRPGNVARFLFPFANVNAYGGQVIQFGKEGFRLYNSKRAPGAAIKRIEFGYAGVPFAIQPRALEAAVPYERMRDASQVPGIDLSTRYLNLVMGAQELEHEYDCAQIALNAANYDNDHKVTLTGADSWYVDTIDPTKDVITGQEAIGDSIGVEGNTVLLSGKAFNACRTNPKIIERIKYTGRDTVTPELLAALWDVQRVVVGRAKTAAGANDAFTNVWGVDVVVAYVPEEDPEGNSMEEPSYGYTYRIEGMPAVEDAYQDKNVRSWVHQVANDFTPVPSGLTAGYLIKGAGTPAA